MSVPIQPLGDYVVIEQEKAEAKTAAGILLPETAKEKPKIAKVIAVGPGHPTDDGKMMIKPTVKVGDRVLYREGYNTTEFKLEGTTYLVLKEEDILATVK